MRSNHTLSLLRNQRPALGTWLQLHSIHATRMLVAQGCFDWMLVDMEHTPVDYTTAAHIFSTISDMSQGRITPLARVAVGSIEHIKQALDCGAQGIIVPMVNNAQQARDAVRFSRFPPAGERGGGGLAAHLGFGVSRPTYMANANPQILVGIQIETVEALQNLDEILDVPGIDMIFIGPNDLHLSLGLPAMFWSDHKPFQDAIAKIRAACAQRGLPLGTLCRDAAQARARAAEGMTFIGLGSDAHFLLTYAGQEFGAYSGEPEPPETWCHTLRTFKDR